MAPPVVNPKVLLLGSTGLLGGYIAETTPEGYALFCTHYAHSRQGSFTLDITEHDSLETVFTEIQPDIVINAATVGAVDQVENWPWDGFKVNTESVIDIVELARAYDVKQLVHVSSNAVFNGRNPPYAEGATLSPINEYGRQKAAADNAIPLELGWAIVRPILMYGWPTTGRQNIATLCLKALRAMRVFKAAKDVVSQPLYAKDCAQFIWKVVKESLGGLYHIAGPRPMTIYEFAQAVAIAFGYAPSMIEAVFSFELELSAMRPRDTAFCLDKLYGTGFRTVALEEGLAQMREEAWKYI